MVRVAEQNQELRRALKEGERSECTLFVYDASILLLGEGASRQRSQCKRPAFGPSLIRPCALSMAWRTSRAAVNTLALSVMANIGFPHVGQFTVWGGVQFEVLSKRQTFLHLYVSFPEVEHNDIE